MNDDKKLSTFVVDGNLLPVDFIETQKVKEGVMCDVYVFLNDNSKDLAIVRVQSGHKTPLQRVLSGIKTIEGYVAGEGTLTIHAVDGTKKTHRFKPGDYGQTVGVRIDEVMQWSAADESDLTFYEICEPPYEDGRFENLPE